MVSPEATAMAFVVFRAAVPAVRVELEATVMLPLPKE
jgi:hypothetical protein